VSATILHVNVLHRREIAEISSLLGAVPDSDLRREDGACAPWKNVSVLLPSSPLRPKDRYASNVGFAS